MNGLTLNSGCFKGGEREVLFDPWPWDMIVSFRRSNARGSRYSSSWPEHLQMTITIDYFFLPIPPSNSYAKKIEKKKSSRDNYTFWANVGVLASNFNLNPWHLRQVAVKDGIMRQGHRSPQLPYLSRIVFLMGPLGRYIIFILKWYQAMTSRSGRIRKWNNFSGNWIIFFLESCHLGLTKVERLKFMICQKLWIHHHPEVIIYFSRSW